MALKVHSSSVFLVASTMLLSSSSVFLVASTMLLSACASVHPLGLGIPDLLQHPESFNQRHVRVSGCLLSHTSDAGEKLLVLAATCDLAIGPDFNLVSAKVLDITIPSGQSPQDLLPLGPATLDATFRLYGRDPLNINLSGMSRVGELVLASN